MSPIAVDDKVIIRLVRICRLQFLHLKKVSSKIGDFKNRPEKVFFFFNINLFKNPIF